MQYTVTTLYTEYDVKKMSNAMAAATRRAASRAGPRCLLNTIYVSENSNIYPTPPSTHRNI
jgi:hypothetical protein